MFQVILLGGDQGGFPKNFMHLFYQKFTNTHILRIKQAEADVVPSSSLVEVEVQIEIGVEVEVEVEVEVR